MNEKELFESAKAKEKWFSENYEDLKREYTGQFVAVVGPDEVYANSNIEGLMKKLEKEGIDSEQVFISPITSKKSAAIL